MRFGMPERFADGLKVPKVDFEVSRLTVRASGGETAINKGWRKGKL